MKAVVQRISAAKIVINEGAPSEDIGAGLLVLLGIMDGDTSAQVEYLAKKIASLRIFTDDAGKQNLSLGDIRGEMMIVSNFTLGADCTQGRRPFYASAARPEEARPLYEAFVEKIKAMEIPVQTGEFGAHMDIYPILDGPVTIILDTKELGK